MSAVLTTSLIKNPGESSSTKPKINKTRRKKKRSEMVLGTWNVPTLLRAGAIKEVVLQMKKFKIDLLAVQNVRWKDHGENSHVTT